VPNYETTKISPKHHDAIVAWQRANFPELDLLERNWSKYFGAQTPFALVAKVGPSRSATIDVGRFQGTPKIQRAGDMQGNMFYSARDIVRAQCSTELGSIQQHRETLEAAISEEAKYAVLRIMAEELRHAYQMFWVLDHDPTWKKVGMGDVSQETIDELLAMETGTHVLDAFNIRFGNFLDNSVYASVIDLVGKYQLQMQQVFAYEPMARSMGPMLSEEGFHMGSGRRIVAEVAAAAGRGEGTYSMDDVQRALNCWVPRGLEMFGREDSGATTVAFGFKDKTNGEAQAEYIGEVKGIVRNWNLAFVTARLPRLDRGAAETLISEVESTGEVREGIRPEDLVRLPDRKFFRRRGLSEFVFRPFSLEGDLLTREGKPLSAEAYLGYLGEVLPRHYLATEDFARFRAALLAEESGGDPSDPFRG
jgi:1,2-phenylacetyl-CoA epoxidase catalytic subunit